MYNSSVVTISVSDARATLPDLLNKVEQGEEVTITRHGQPIAVVVRPDALRPRAIAQLREASEEIERRLQAAARRPRREATALPAGYADRLVAEVRADRDSGL
jgi:prevent-host-death family protein